MTGERVYLAWCYAFGWCVEWRLLETSKREKWERMAERLKDRK